MELSDTADVFLYILIAIVGTIGHRGMCAAGLARASGCIASAGRARGTSGRSHHVIWRDPGDVARADMADGPGGVDGAPAAAVPVHRRALDRIAAVRLGPRRARPPLAREMGQRSAVRELRGSARVGVRLFRGDDLLHRSGDALRARQGLQRARACIDEDCRFADARFELDDPAVRKMFEEHSWAWNDNPFVGTPQLHGLKVLVMLLSDWDTKDRRDVARGSNTAIFEHRVSRWRREARYLITDWGGSMGRWGSNIVTRGRWDPEGFAAQTPQFVTGVDGRPGPVRLRRPAHRRRRRRDPHRRRPVAVSVSRADHRRAAARGARGQRRQRGGGRQLRALAAGSDLAAGTGESAWPPGHA